MTAETGTLEGYSAHNVHILGYQFSLRYITYSTKKYAR